MGWKGATLKSKDDDKYWDDGILLVSGCTPVSSGCDHCWSRGMQKRFGGDPDAVVFHAERLKRLETRRPTIISIWNDLFHEKVGTTEIDQTFAHMALNPQNTYLVLTKRAWRMQNYFKELVFRQESIGIEAESISGIDRFDRADPDNPKPRWKLPLSNVWLGVTAENQPMTDKRISQLLATQAAVRIVSVEPMLDEIDIREYLPTIKWAYDDELTNQTCYRDEPIRSAGAYQVRTNDEGVDWIVCGAETGAGRRPCKLEWVRSLVQ